MTEHMRASILTRFANDVTLTEQSCRAFDTFVSKHIPDIVKESHTLKIKANVAEETREISLRMIGGTVKQPVMLENDGTSKPVFPNECRLRNLTYGSPLYVDVEVERKDIPPTLVKDVYLGRIPIMVYSSLCHLRDHTTRVAHGECPNDPGGYFIVNGSEKSLIGQKSSIINRKISYSHGEGRSRSCAVAVKSEKHRRIYVTTISYKPNAPITCTFPRLQREVPLLDILIALGLNVDHIKSTFSSNDRNLLAPCFKNLPADRAEARRRLTIREVYNVGLSKDERLDQAFEQVMLPHVEMANKGLFFLTMMRELLAVAKGDIEPTDRDAATNQRVETSNELLTTLFHHLIIKLTNDIKLLCQKGLVRLKRGVTDEKVREWFSSTTVITDGFQYAIATGNWNTSFINRIQRVGVAQSLQRLTLMSTISQLRRISSSIEKTQKLAKPRYLHGTHWGRYCPAETPEGQPCGLETQLSLQALISLPNESDSIQKLIAQFLKPLTINNLSVGISVFVNGTYVGNTTVPGKLLCSVRQLRRSGQCSQDVSVSQSREIHISTTPGRLCRPLLIVSKGKLRYNASHDKMPWRELITSGVIEYLDCEEEDTMLVAFEPEEITKKHTHCEIDCTLINGLCAASIPYSDHNPAPRNTYQSAMGKQAQGVSMLNYRSRFDTTQNILQYGQKPLVSTHLADLYNLSENSGGQNAIVAIMPYEGFGQEDSIIVNVASLDRGFGRADCYKTVVATTNRKDNERFAIPTKFRKVGKYTKLDADGLVSPGEVIDKQDCLVGKQVDKISSITTLQTTEDASVMSDMTGRIDDVYLFQQRNSDRAVKMKVRTQRIPVVGDKFCQILSSYVMTTDGWVQLKDVTLQHKVATLRDGVLDYVHPTAKYIFDCHEEELYHLDAQQVKIICTKNHKLYVKKQDKDHFEFVEAQDAFGKRVRHKKDAINNRVDQEFMNIDGVLYAMDPFLKLLGSFISDGFVDIGEKYRRISLCMKKERKKHFIKTTLEEMGVHFNIRPDRVHIGNTYHQLVDYFKILSVGAPKKYLPQFVWKLSQRQSVMLMNALLQGDGSYNGSGSVGYYTSSRRLAEDVQRLALHCGWSGTIKLVREKGLDVIINGKKTGTANYDQLVVRTVKKKNNPQVNHGHVHKQTRQIEEYVRYTGQVGCIEVPATHLFFYKEDLYSPPCWTGNSSRHGQKGTIGMTYGAEDLPWTMDGMTPDILINPHALPSRMTIAHLIETLAAKKAAVTGEIADASPFQKRATVDEIAADLKKLGFKPNGNETLYSGTTGLPLQAKIFIGPIFYQRLKHMVDDKINARGRGRRNQLTGQPNEGKKKGGGQRVGYMEKDCMNAHGAAHVINERMMISSDIKTITVCPHCQVKIYGECKTCNAKGVEINLPSAADLLFQELKSMCINVKLVV